MCCRSPTASCSSSSAGSCASSTAARSASRSCRTSLPGVPADDGDGANPVARTVPMTTIGLWLSTPEPLVAEGAARARPDWVGLDLQHGAFDLGTAFRGIQLLDALRMPALVRVSEQELELIPRLLDHGAAGVVVAMASSPALAEEAVRRARYQPEGMRSFGGQRYGMRSAPDDPSQIRPNIYPMIEDRRGVADVAAIAAGQGVARPH